MKDLRSDDKILTLDLSRTTGTQVHTTDWALPDIEVHLFYAANLLYQPFEKSAVMTRSFHHSGNLPRLRECFLPHLRKVVS